MGDKPQFDSLRGRISVWLVCFLRSLIFSSKWTEALNLWPWTAADQPEPFFLCLKVIKNRTAQHCMMSSALKELFAAYEPRICYLMLNSCCCLLLMKNIAYSFESSQTLLEIVYKTAVLWCCSHALGCYAVCVQERVGRLKNYELLLLQFMKC